MRLYTHTHTHTGVLKNKEKERQEEVESINAADSLLEEKTNILNSTSMSTNYVNNITNKENCVKSVDRTNDKAEKKEQTKKIKRKEGKLQKVSCLLVMRKIAAIVILMIIVLAILVCFGIKYNWQIENIIEEIGKVINIKGTSAEIEEVAAMDMTKVDLVPDKNGVNVPVPKGYVLSGASDENDVTKGAVIYEGTTAVTDANVATEKTTRNQWVWVSVSAANVSRIYKEDAYGRKSGRLYDYSYDGRTWSSLTVEGGFEPGIVKDEDVEEYLQQYNLYGYTQSKLYEEVQKNYEETIESIKIYGGFYIGRYETGNLSERKPVCVQYNQDIYKQTWYTMYNKLQYLGGNVGVKSMMIYGSLWDEVLQWLYEHGVSYYDIGGNSFNWGNVKNASFEYYPSANAEYISTKGTDTLLLNDGMRVIPTGARAGYDSQKYKRNCKHNIYDLAGNVWDATQECYSDDIRCRGSCYSLSNGAAADRTVRDKIIDWDNSVGCRAQLIIL